MKVLIRPKKLSGVLDCVPSKSYSHRAIIAASLAKGKSVVSNLLFSNDILATIDACRAIGAKIDIYSNYVEIEGLGKVIRKSDIIDANESGSTIRFMIPIALVASEPITFIGHNNLVNRPLDLYFDIFDKQGIKYEKEEAYLPLHVSGGLKSGEFSIRGDVSSQFITGLLFTLPLLDGNSVINITTNLESKAYVDLTLDILNKFGIKITHDNYQKFYIEGNQEYLPYNYEVEGDYSQAAFFLVGAALGNDIKLCCMNLDSLQGDKKILADLSDMGYSFKLEGDALTLVSKNPRTSVIDFSQSPDLGPIESVLASLIPGDTKFINCERLRIKECDRITCVKEELNKIGAKVSETQTEMNFIGVDGFTGGVVSSHNDHRLAMAFAFASTMCTNELVILGAEAVKKSYPTFWSDFRKLGGDFDEIN